ncbi:hypothetical protein DL98DRAFT_6333 [Cadophora sp. DSE1049]|nr:hypothetical protein DL98DRAFT_6333 [Cadophora sp. DSE1049]
MYLNNKVETSLTMSKLSSLFVVFLLTTFFATGSPTPTSPTKHTAPQTQSQLCFCQTTHSGLFCGSRTQDAAGMSGLPAMLSGHCEPNYVYRCNGSAVSPAKIQVYCGLCKRGVDGTSGTDRCYE